MDVLLSGNAERDFRAGLFHGSRHRDVDAPLDFADVVGIVSTRRRSPGPRSFLKSASSWVTESRMLAFCFLPASALFGVRSVAEQALEGHARIDFGRQRLRGVGPGYASWCTRSCIPSCSCRNCRRVFDAELNG